MDVDVASPELTLGPKGCSKLGKGYTRAQVAELLTYLIERNYVEGCFRRLGPEPTQPAPHL